MFMLIASGSVFPEVPAEVPLDELREQMRDDGKRGLKGKLGMGRNGYPQSKALDCVRAPPESCREPILVQ